MLAFTMALSRNILQASTSSLYLTCIGGLTNQGQGIQYRIWNGSHKPLDCAGDQEHSPDR